MKARTIGNKHHPQPGIDIPRWDADMSHWLFFKVYPPEVPGLAKKFQPPVEDLIVWKGNPDIYSNSGYRCSTNEPECSGTIFVKEER